MQLTLDIVVLSAIYALVSAGYVMVYRVSRVLNLAHGEFMMAGAYLLHMTSSFFSGNPVLAVFVAAFMGLVIGILIYVFLMRFMTGKAVLAAVLCTLALGVLVQGMIVLIWSAQIRHPMVALGWDNPSINLIGDARISLVNLVLVITTILVYIGLFSFLAFTKWGIQMRATGQNPLLASQRGIQLHGVYALSWGLATFTGGLAGMLISMDTGLDSSMAVIGLKAFPAALVGGLDSLLGAIVGSAIIALSETMIVYYFDPLLSDAAPFLVLLLVLFFRPWGLFGSKEELDRV